MIREQERSVGSGITMLVGGVALLGLSLWGLVAAIRADSLPGVLSAIAGLTLAAIALAGLFTVAPNEARVLQLFGAYSGTVRTPGLRWANPFYTKKKISVRVRNFESSRLKVNDSDGNPIEIAAVVVWRVVDTAEASSRSTTTATTCTCRASRRCATWRRAIRTMRTTTRTRRCADTPRRSPST